MATFSRYAMQHFNLTNTTFALMKAAFLYNTLPPVKSITFTHATILLSFQITITSHRVRPWSTELSFKFSLPHDTSCSDTTRPVTSRTTNCMEVIRRNVESNSVCDAWKDFPDHPPSPLPGFNAAFYVD